jgi:hypothetical protein
LFTVTNEYPITMFDAPPVPSGMVAETFAEPQLPLVVTKPALIATTLSSTAQVARLVTSLVAGG